MEATDLEIILEKPNITAGLKLAYMYMYKHRKLGSITTSCSILNQ